MWAKQKSIEVVQRREGYFDRSHCSVRIPIHPSVHTATLTSPCLNENEKPGKVRDKSLLAEIAGGGTRLRINDSGKRSRKRYALEREILLSSIRDGR